MRTTTTNGIGSHVIIIVRLFPGLQQSCVAAACTVNTIHYNTLGKTHPPIWRVFLSVNEKGEFYNVMTRINTRCSLLLLLGSFQTKFPTPFLCTPQYVPIHGIRFSRLFRENVISSSSSSSLSPAKLASPVSRKTLFTRVPSLDWLIGPL